MPGIQLKDQQGQVELFCMPRCKGQEGPEAQGPRGPGVKLRHQWGHPGQGPVEARPQGLGARGPIERPGELLVGAFGPEGARVQGSRGPGVQVRDHL